MILNTEPNESFTIIIVVIPINLIGTFIFYKKYIEKVQSFNLFLEKEELNRELEYQKENLNEEVKIRTKDLIYAKEKAEESDRLKSAFLANMSHEIRTPMNGIIGFTNLLSNKDLSKDDQHKYINIINKSGERLLNTINDIIDISKIDSKQIQLKIESVNISEIVKELEEFFQIQCAEKGIKLEISNNVYSPTIILQIDRTKIQPIFTNLIRNAVKYTSKGKIQVGVDRKNNELIFFIKDLGIGIPEDRQSAIFERFVQADIEDSKALQGSGLGLSISRSYAEMLGGEIWVESEVNIGSTFFLKLPDTNSKNELVESSIISSKETTKTQNLNQLKILIAEDDQISYNYLKEILQNFVDEIIHCNTGEEAIEQMKFHQDVDVILMDIKMPILNGFEATKQIREFNKDVRIIFQTAHAFSIEKEKAFESGGNDYITKPIDKNTLLQLLTK